MTFNEQLADRFTRHAVDLERFKASVRMDALRTLRKLERDLKDKLHRIDIGEVKATVYKQARLNALLLQTRETIGSALKTHRSEFEKQLRGLAATEDEFVRGAVNRIAGIELMTVAITAEQVKAIVSDLVIEGAPHREWWSRQAKSLQMQFGDTVRQGMLSGSTNDEIARNVAAFMEGTIRRDVEALVVTSVQAVSQAARLATYSENLDVISALQQRSTLDMRTTPICRGYSGKVWDAQTKKPIGHSLPFINSGGASSGCPRHWRCRSTFLPIVKAFKDLEDMQTGGRPSSGDAYFRKRLKELGLDDGAISRAVRNAQASMNGQVPKDWSYEEWLRRQPVSIQREVLGAKRFDLWQRGKITSLAQLLDQSGSPLTLEGLRKRIGK